MISRSSCFFWVGDAGLQHKTVDLCLGQRIGTLLFQRVLRGQYEERLRQFIRFVADGYLSLLHRLEQRTLHLGRGTVDLIGQDKVGKDRAFTYGKLLPFLRIDHGTEQVGRQQIGGKLDSAEFGIHRLSQRGNGQGFGQTRHTLEQDMSVCEQADKQCIDQMFLTDNHFAHLHIQRIDEDAFAFDTFVELFDVDNLTHYLLSIIV